jgi:hypothetical protein
MPNVTTRVYQLPADETARSKFVNGLKALEEECCVTFLAGSLNNEMTYIEMLEAELNEHIGENAVEDIRQKFECEQRVALKEAASAEPQ